MVLSGLRYRIQLALKDRPWPPSASPPLNSTASPQQPTNFTTHTTTPPNIRLPLGAFCKEELTTIRFSSRRRITNIANTTRKSKAKGYTATESPRKHHHHHAGQDSEGKGVLDLRKEESARPQKKKKTQATITSPPFVIDSDDPTALNLAPKLTTRSPPSSTVLTKALTSPAHNSSKPAAGVSTTAPERKKTSKRQKVFEAVPEKLREKKIPEGETSKKALTKYAGACLLYSCGKMGGKEGFRDVERLLNIKSTRKSDMVQFYSEDWADDTFRLDGAQQIRNFIEQLRTDNPLDVDAVSPVYERLCSSGRMTDEKAPIKIFAAVMLGASMAGVPFSTEEASAMMPVGQVDEGLVEYLAAFRKLLLAGDGLSAIRLGRKG
ncbi:hypothetical protein BJ508DRAFT_381535 [Ascobolus immersus RN42]|uniref:Uncharacterized protein n=1 Tax=Ascobolus immersus RN42 TaxID=1160509 RepID=A0A3N4HE28_ASCIM|nr:hypothetical protein BJ508DRAFT_381535 [Ascobolus immersus RN42]